MSTPDTIHDTTLLDNHIQSMLDALHKIQSARKQDTLQPEEMTHTLAELSSNLARDFPPEYSATESSVQDLLTGYLDRVSVRKIAAPTGMGILDSVLGGGFQAKRLVTLLGGPGSGKTSLANQWSEKIAHERPVFYVTSEDSSDILIAKTLSRIGDVSYGDVLYGRDVPGIKRAMGMLLDRQSARNLRYLDVSAGVITMNEVCDRARAHFEGKTGSGLIVIDYLQRMARSIRDNTGGKELREAVTQLTERLRAIACELDCCVLAIASMNRASGYGKGNKDSDNSLTSAKESGDIEYTADVMMALTDDNSAKRVTATHISPRILRVDKNRQGPVTSINLDWYANRQQFTEAKGV